MSYWEDIASETDILTAERCYGSALDVRPRHRMARECPSWTAHLILVRAFGFAGEDASDMVSELITESGGRFAPVFSEFGTDDRTWLLGCTYAPFISGSRFNIYLKGEAWWSAMPRDALDR